MKIIDLLTNSAASRKQTIAVKSDEMQLSYGRMLSDVWRLSKRLKSAGCRQGVKVAIIFGNSIEYFISFFAISAAGGTILPLSVRMTTYETVRYIDRADVSIVITNRIYGKRLLKQSGIAGKITVINIRYDNHKNLETEAVASSICKVDERNGDVALMVYTSGTTGPPKIVMLTDSQLISNMVTYRSLMGFGSHNVVCCSLPLRHIYCVCAQILTHISLADTFVLNDGPFFIRDFLKAVESQKVTITAFVPYMAMLLAEFPESERFNLGSLRYVTLSGAKTPKSTYKLLTEKYSHIQFINTYGMSEAGSRISIAAPFPNRFPIESVGRPMPGVEVKIAGDRGNVLPPEAIGEVEVKSSGVMKGYYRQPDLTNETIVGGWLKTGDIGTLDEKGNLFLVGRKKGIIISGGEKIYPSEIEECLMEHPAILEAAVVARRDRHLQEVPCAFVVKNRLSKEVIPIEIIGFCKKRLSSHKTPRSIKFLDRLPKLGTWKIDRNTLRNMVNNLP